MVFHLAAPCIQDQLTLRPWRPGTLTVRVQYRGPFRLPAVRVTGVLAGPAQERGHCNGGAKRLPGSSTRGSSCREAQQQQQQQQSAFWASSRSAAASAFAAWNNMVEAHSAKFSQNVERSIQTLQRVGSRILRSMSHDSVADMPGAAGADGEGGGAGSGSGADGAMQQQLDESVQAAATLAASIATAAVAAEVALDQQHVAAAMAAAMEAAVAAATAASRPVPSLEEQEAMLQRQLDQLGQLQASLSQFVTTASRTEVNMACMLADLSNIAYDVRQIVDGSLLETRHGLRLVACSHPDHVAPAAADGSSPFACVLPMPAAGEMDDGGGLEFDFHLQPSQWGHLESFDGAAAASTRPAPAGGSGPAAPCWEGPAPAYGYVPFSLPLSPRAPAVVSAMTLLEASEADGAAPAAVCSGGGVQRRASGIAAAPGSHPARRRSADGVASTPFAAAACLDAPLAPAAAMPLHAGDGDLLRHLQNSPQLHRSWQVLERPADGSEEAALEQQPPAAALPSASAPAAQLLDAAADAEQPAKVGAAAAPAHPADWFVCDAPADPQSGAAATRYFVIQGSITVDHWRINLTIDPVPFVDESTGVKVHRCASSLARSWTATNLPSHRTQAFHPRPLNSPFPLPHPHPPPLPGACMTPPCRCTMPWCRWCRSTSPAPAPAPRSRSRGTASAAAWRRC
jgi:hypothetical protein